MGRILGEKSPDSQTGSHKGNCKIMSNFEELDTLLGEIECVVNARPITYV